MSEPHVVDPSRPGGMTRAQWKNRKTRTPSNGRSDRTFKTVTTEEYVPGAAFWLPEGVALHFAIHPSGMNRYTRRLGLQKTSRFQNVEDRLLGTLNTRAEDIYEAAYNMHFVDPGPLSGSLHNTLHPEVKLAGRRAFRLNAEVLRRAGA